MIKVHIPTERYGYVEREYENINDFEDNYSNDYLIIKVKQEEAEEDFAREKIEKISEALLEEINEEKFGDLTEEDKVASCFDMAAKAKRLRKINVLEKMKYKYINKLTIN